MAVYHVYVDLGNAETAFVHVDERQLQEGDLIEHDGRIVVVLNDAVSEPDLPSLPL